MICFTCALTVLSDIESASAMSLFDLPWLMRARTSRWRRVSSDHGSLECELPCQPPDRCELELDERGRHIDAAGEDEVERPHQDPKAQRGGQEAARPGAQDLARALRVVGLGHDHERRLGKGAAERLDLAQIDMLGRRRADQNEIEMAAAAHQVDELVGVAGLGHLPFGTVLRQGEAQAFAPQAARIDNGDRAVGMGLVRGVFGSDRRLEACHGSSLQ